MDRLARGDLGALDHLYEHYGAMAFSIAYRITGDRAAAEDVVQEAFLGAWRNAARYVDARGSVRTWLLSIVHHRAIDAIRRRRPTVELPEAEASLPDTLTLPDAWADVELRLDRESVQAALGAHLRRPARGDRAGLLRRADPDRDRGAHGRPARDGQGPAAPRPRRASAPRCCRWTARDRTVAEHTFAGLTCAEVADLAPAFVLGALEPAESDAVRRHLAECPEAHAEMAELGSVVPALFEVVEPVAPPAGLKDRILAAAAADTPAGRRCATASRPTPPARSRARDDPATRASTRIARPGWTQRLPSPGLGGRRLAAVARGRRARRLERRSSQDQNRAPRRLPAGRRRRFSTEAAQPGAQLAVLAAPEAGGTVGPRRRGRGRHGRHRHARPRADDRHARSTRRGSSPATARRSRSASFGSARTARPRSSRRPGSAGVRRDRGPDAGARTGQHAPTTTPIVAGQRAGERPRPS